MTFALHILSCSFTFTVCSGALECAAWLDNTMSKIGQLIRNPGNSNLLGISPGGMMADGLSWLCCGRSNLADAAWDIPAGGGQMTCATSTLLCTVAVHHG